VRRASNLSRGATSTGWLSGLLGRPLENPLQNRSENQVSLISPIVAERVLVQVGTPMCKPDISGNAIRRGKFPNPRFPPSLDHQHSIRPETQLQRTLGLGADRSQFFQGSRAFRARKGDTRTRMKQVRSSHHLVSEHLRDKTRRHSAPRNSSASTRLGCQAVMVTRYKQARSPAMAPVV
jgi:hypothetical protein